MLKPLPFIWLALSLPNQKPSTNNDLYAVTDAIWNAILEGFNTSRGDFTHAALLGALMGEKNVSSLSAETLSRYEYVVGQADPMAIQSCVELISQTDFSEKIQHLGDAPILCIHGTDDSGMPYVASTKIVKELVPRVEVKLYDGAAHWLQVLRRDPLLEDILAFVRGKVL